MEPALNLLAADNESIKRKYPTDDDRLNINVNINLENYLIYTSVRNTDHVTLICHLCHTLPVSFLLYILGT